MVNFKEWNLQHFSNLLVLSFVLFLVIAMMHVFVSPLLVTTMPTVFTGTLTLTDTLLFLILLRLIVK